MTNCLHLDALRVWSVHAISSPLTLAPVPGERAGVRGPTSPWCSPTATCRLEQVPVDIECSMEDAEDVDRFGAFDDVRDAIMAMEEDADMPVRVLPVAVP
jgi:hypothetical protein